MQDGNLLDAVVRSLKEKHNEEVARLTSEMADLRQQANAAAAQFNDLCLKHGQEEIQHANVKRELEEEIGALRSKLLSAKTKRAEDKNRINTLQTEAEAATRRLQKCQATIQEQQMRIGQLEREIGSSSEKSAKIPQAPPVPVIQEQEIGVSKFSSGTQTFIVMLDKYTNTEAETVPIDKEVTSTYDVSLLVDYKNQILKSQRKLEKKERIIENQGEELKETREEIVQRDMIIADLQNAKSDLETQLIYKEGEVNQVIDEFNKYREEVEMKTAMAEREMLNQRDGFENALAEKDALIEETQKKVDGLISDNTNLLNQLDARQALITEKEKFIETLGDKLSAKEATNGSNEVEIESLKAFIETLNLELDKAKQEKEHSELVLKSVQNEMKDMETLYKTKLESRDIQENTMKNLLEEYQNKSSECYNFLKTVLFELNKLVGYDQIDDTDTFEGFCDAVKRRIVDLKLIMYDITQLKDQKQQLEETSKTQAAMIEKNNQLLYETKNTNIELVSKLNDAEAELKKFQTYASRVDRSLQNIQVFDNDIESIIEQFANGNGIIQLSDEAVQQVHYNKLLELFENTMEETISMYKTYIDSLNTAKDDLAAQYEEQLAKQANELDPQRVRSEYEDKMAAQENNHIIECNAIKVQYEGEIDTLKKQLSDLDNELKAQSTRSIREENENLTMINNSLLDQNNSLLEKLDKVKRKFEDAKNQKLSDDKVIEMLRDESEQLATQVQELEEYKQDAEAQIESLTAQLQELEDTTRAETEKLKSDAVEMEEMFEAYKMKMGTSIDDLLEQIGTSEEAINEQKKKYDDLSSEYSKALETIAGLHTTIETLQNDAYDAKTQLKEQAFSAKAAYDALNNELMMLKGQQESAEKELKAAHDAMVAQMDEKSNTLRKQYKAKKSAYIDKIGGMEEEMKRLNAVIEEKEKENDELNHTNADMSNAMALTKEQLTELIRKFKEQSEKFNSMVDKNQNNEALITSLKEEMERRDIAEGLLREANQYFNAITELCDQIEKLRMNMETANEALLLTNAPFSSTLLVNWKASMDEILGLKMSLINVIKEYGRSATVLKDNITYQTQLQQAEERAQLYYKTICELRKENIKLLESILDFSPPDAQLLEGYKKTLANQYKDTIEAQRLEIERLNQLKPLQLQNENEQLKLSLRDSQLKGTTKVNEMLRLQIKAGSASVMQRSQVGSSVKPQSVRPEPIKPTLSTSLPFKNQPTSTPVRAIGVRFPTNPSSQHSKWADSRMTLSRLSAE